jgi:hypothetical protein
MLERLKIEFLMLNFHQWSNFLDFLLSEGKITMKTYSKMKSVSNAIEAETMAMYIKLCR